jgi:NADH dehydrogenase (ubiquinone) 1 alpha subcomplex subunit 10
VGESMAQMIIIEGNIGAGKSTLTDRLAKQLNGIPMYEPVESNPYLADFYKDPKRYALEMQFWLMSKRYQLHLDAIEKVWREGKTVIMDRSIYGDFIFAKAHQVLGNIDEQGFANYMAMRNTMERTLLIPQVTIYLNVTVDNCLKRINERARGCETGITGDYLMVLEKIYRELMHDLKAKGSNVIDIDHNEFKDVDYILKEIGDKISRFSAEYPGISN